MSTLRICLFGSIRLIVDNNSEDIRLSRGLQELFAYLVLQRHRTHSRDKLAGRLWENLCQERAKDCLNTALWRLRRILEPEAAQRGRYLITTPDGEIGFNGNSDYWLDIEDFSTTAEYVLRSSPERITWGEALELEKTISLYSGDFLEGLYVDWILREREYLRLLYVDSLAHLMIFYKNQENYPKSLRFGLRILQVDPVREEVHREIMRLYWANGQRALAVRQYECCREALQAELGILPMEETRLLHRKILEDGLQQGLTSLGNDRHSDIEASLQVLDRAISSFIELQGQLMQALQEIRSEIELDRQLSQPSSAQLERIW